MVIAIIIIAILFICYLAGDSETNNTSNNVQNNNVSNSRNTATNKDAEYNEVLQILGKYWLEYKKGAFAEAPTKQLITQYKLDSKYGFNKDDVWEALKRYNEVFECFPNTCWSTRSFPNVIIDYASYLEELEFQYKIYLTEMFKPQKIQDFISHFYLGKRNITSEDVLKDLQEIVLKGNQNDSPDSKQVPNSVNKFDKKQSYADKSPINDEKALIEALEKCASENIEKTLSTFHKKYFLNNYNISPATLRSKAVAITNKFREQYILPEHILQEKRKEREQSVQKNKTNSNTNSKQAEQESVSNGITVNLQPPIQIGYYTENPMPFLIERIILKDYMAYLYDSIGGSYIRVHLLNGRNKFNCDTAPTTKFTQTAYQSSPCWAVLNTICTASVIWEGNYPFSPNDVFSTLSTQSNAELASYGFNCEITSSLYRFKRNGQNIAPEIVIRTLCFATPATNTTVCKSVANTMPSAKKGNSQPSQIYDTKSISTSENKKNTTNKAEDMLMYNNPSCIEFVLVPGSKDYDFFSEIIDVAHRIPMTKDIIPVDGKQKSVILTGNKLYICQHAKFPYVNTAMELFVCFDNDNHTFRICDSVPDTDCYRAAVPCFWIYLMVTLGFMEKHFLSYVAEALSDNRSLQYNEHTHEFINTATRQPASLSEMLLALSLNIIK